MKQIKNFCDRCGKEARVYNISIIYGHPGPELCQACEVELHKAISEWWPEFGKGLFRTVHEGMRRQEEAKKEQAIRDLMR
jgi:hypothetical protein